MTEDVDPLMEPLFARYNRMVKRMRDLDVGHVKREEALQQEVDEASRALIQQQAVLARAEVMAAVGDMSARLAHDLRNPLSGALLALTNLRGEVDAPEHSDRLGTVIQELERIVRLLNNLVDESRQSPERPQRLQLRSVIDDLLKLLRYQLDARIAINANVPENIYCRLPEAGFRNVLLNLMLNAAQAIGERPGAIEIAAAVDAGRVELRIGDDGPGFPEELLKTGVYERGTWRIGGTGFGLATARRFALEHGSSLELRNGTTGGATVILRFPVEDCDD
jgi:signal transduction histidine kinase